ncbi:MAG: hypothetical protein ACOC0R_01845 [Mariniphaga sp.]
MGRSVTGYQESLNRKDYKGKVQDLGKSASRKPGNRLPACREETLNPELFTAIRCMEGRTKGRGCVVTIGPRYKCRAYTPGSGSRPQPGVL